MSKKNIADYMPADDSKAPTKLVQAKVSMELWKKFLPILKKQKQRKIKEFIEASMQKFIDEESVRK
jgi:hypothetical protein